MISLAPDYSHLLSSPHMQSGKYIEMDPILISADVSEYVIKELSNLLYHWSRCCNDLKFQ